jgi:hypothetical protein
MIIYVEKIVGMIFTIAMHYYFYKLCLLLWLFHPETKRSIYVYDNLILYYWNEYKYILAKFPLITVMKNIELTDLYSKTESLLDFKRKVLQTL